MIKDVKYVEIKGGSHGITWTRAQEINTELVSFFGLATKRKSKKFGRRSLHLVEGASTVKIRDSVAFVTGVQIEDSVWYSRNN
jgi:hypothetical protein